MADDMFIDGLVEELRNMGKYDEIKNLIHHFPNYPLSSYYLKLCNDMLDNREVKKEYSVVADKELVLR